MILFLISLGITVCLWLYLEHANKLTKSGFANSSLVLGYFNNGFSLDGKRKMSIKDSLRHSLVIGQSGSGKSTVCYLPSILRTSSNISYIIHDPSGELREKSGPYLQKIGYSVKVINLANPKQSHSYNPLKRLDNSYASAKRLANIIVTSALSHGGSDNFWNNKGENILAVFIAFTKQLEEKYHHMGTVLSLLNSFSSNPIGVDVLVADKCKDNRLFEEYKTIAATDSKLMSNILSTAKAAISIFEDESIMALTSQDDIDFSDLRAKPTVIFLQSSIMQLRYHAPLFSIILTQLMEELISSMPKRQDRTIFMLLDEMGVLNLPHFSDFLSNCRKYRIGCLLGCQTTGQIVSKYGKEEGNNIIANCYSQLFFSNQPIETCQILEKMGGYFEEEKNGKMERKLVLPAHEVRILNSKEAIFMVGGLKPIKLKLFPAYKSYRLRQRMNSLSNELIFQKHSQTEIDLPYIPKPKKVK